MEMMRELTMKPMVTIMDDEEEDNDDDDNVASFGNMETDARDGVVDQGGGVFFSASTPLKGNRQ